MRQFGLERRIEVAAAQGDADPPGAGIRGEPELERAQAGELHSRGEVTALGPPVAEQRYRASMLAGLLARMLNDWLRPPTPSIGTMVRN